MRISSLYDRILKSAVLPVALLFLWSDSLCAAPKDFGRFSGSQTRNPVPSTGVPPTPGMPTTTGQQNPAGASPFATANGSLGSPQGSNAPVSDPNEYDSEGRIVGFVDSAGNKTQWSFDSQGRQIPRARTATAGAQTEERLDNTFNAYTSVGGVPQTYDLNGNLTGDGTRLYKWDAFNRLREVTTTTGTLIASYTYDADGRRLSKTLGPAATAGVSTDYKYAGWRVMEESAPTTATPRLQRVYGKDLDEVLVENVNRDGDMTCTGTSDTRHFLLQTDLYSLAATYEPGVGIVEAFEFNPYGPAVRLTDGNADGIVNFDETDIRTSFDPSTPGAVFATLYGGHPVDEETGLVDMRHRLYSVEMGCFLSPDPSGYFREASQTEDLARLTDGTDYIVEYPGAIQKDLAPLQQHGNLALLDGSLDFFANHSLISASLVQYVLSKPTKHTDPLGYDITLRTGNDKWLGVINNLVHQSVCVDYWGMSLPGPTVPDGKYCFSFGMNGCKASLPSNAWLGWVSRNAGGPLRGVIYEAGNPEDGQFLVGHEVARQRTTRAQDKNWLHYMQSSREGLTDTYSLARHNCRMYSQMEFADAPKHW